jgi:hypothetical protein
VPIGESRKGELTEERFGQSRRDFIRALSGAIGVALASDPSKIGELAEAAGRRHISNKLPSGYVFQRLVTVGPNQPGAGDVVEILPGVMINDRSEVIYHARTSSGDRAVYRMRIGRHRKPGAEPPSLIVQAGQTLDDGVVVGRIAAGDTNASGTYATVIGAKNGLNGVYLQRPGESLRPLLRATDRTPDPRGRYTGHFGDVDLGAGGDILLVARYTIPGELHQGLIFLPHGRTKKGKILLRTGQRVPDSRALITGFGLVERRGPYFIQQVFGRQAKHRARHDFKLEPSGFVSGRISKGRRGSRLLVGTKLLRPGRGAVRADALVGPRVDRDGTAATVSHKKSSHLTLHVHNGHGPSRIAHTGGKGSRGEIQTISAPVFGPRGLLFYRTISKHSMELLVADGRERRRVLESGDKIDSKVVKVFNLGWHTDQADRHGRLAFQAEFEDGSTAIVVGTPV